MSINLEVPKKFGTLVNQAHQVSTEIFRPISRKYDQAEHEYPKELDMLAALVDGMNASGESSCSWGLAASQGASKWVELSSARRQLRPGARTRRRERAMELASIIEDVTQHRTTAAWLDALTAAGVPCGKINDLAAVFADPHLS